jgi:hypothetical protein
MLIHHIRSDEPVEDFDGAFGFFCQVLVMRYHNDCYAVFVEFLIKVMTSCAVLESTLPVGSSINRKRGLLANARATATRCC